MSLLNKYLNETPLTSTKNKILEDDLQANGIKRFETKWMTENVYEPKLRRSFLKSKYFVNEKIHRRADFSKKKKKKKRALCAQRYRCAPRNKTMYLKAMAVDQPQRCSYNSSLERDYHSFDFVGCGLENHFEEQSISQLAFEEENALCFPTSDSTISHDALLGKLQKLSERPPLPEKPPLGNNVLRPHTANNLLFGSSPGFSPHAPSMPSVATSASFCTPSMASGFGGSVFRSQSSLNIAVPDKIIMEMPTYKLNVSELSKEFLYETFSYEDSSYVSEKSVANNKKIQFLNVVSMALMYSSDFRDDSDVYRKEILSSADAVRIIDPEFILKVALYARQELQIRNVTNFLLAYSAFHKNTRIYLEKYFDSAIVLPTDWIQVVEYYEILNVQENQPFPAILRRVMKKTFSKFDEYQLAKYNRVKSQKGPKKGQEKKKQKDTKKSKYAIAVSSEDSKKNISLKLTLKHLIRRFHIDSPVEHVMSLLGKKYPTSQEEFKKSGLPGSWDSSKAGIRMKLTIPETWETQISAHGNKPSVWESLIDNRKLPYMALLRNIRNLISSDISFAHHKKATKYLENKIAVMKSRQLPMQYFEAYKAVDELNRVPEICNPDGKPVPQWKKDQIDKRKMRMEHILPSVINDYKEAISRALEISSLNNLHPIPGKTLIICEVNDENNTSGAKLKSYETCIMMGLMCLKACENCKMNIITDKISPEVISINEKDVFLDVVNNTCLKYDYLFCKRENRDSSDEMECEYISSDTGSESLEKLLAYYLKPHSILSVKLDHFVFLHTSPYYDFAWGLQSFLLKYRRLVNPDLLYTDVNYNVRSKRFSQECLLGKDVFLYGTSTSLIKFIAERSTGGQLTCVENIDVKYNLEDRLPKMSLESDAMDLCENEPMDVSDITVPSPLNQKLPKWHTVRIFISSTFKDMISERDLLVRYVFPELRRRAASVFIRLVEIDLRWGITEADSSTKRAAELCLIEAQKADLFVGLIGERYGTIYDFEPPDAPNLEWVKDCPGLSITELEMHAAALRDPESSRKKAFFYFRDNIFFKHVPISYKKWADHFVPEDLQSKVKTDELKQKIRSSGFSVFDGYPCYFAGTFENKPILGGLDALGNRVMEDLWKVIQEIHNEDPYADTVSEEDKYQQYLVDSQFFFVEANKSPIKDLIKEIASKNGIFVITGPPGIGKTAFSVNLLKNIKLPTFVKFFIGISSRSRNVSYMLQYICKRICQLLNIFIPVPNLPNDIINQFPDFLFEVANCCYGRDIVLLIDGLDHLGDDDQMLDWLPLMLPNNVKMICSATQGSEAFQVLLNRKQHGNSIFIHGLAPLVDSEREAFVKEYLSFYRKTLDESVFNNNMSKIVTKKGSSNPLYLRITCDFLRIYATFDNLTSMIQTMPSSIPSIFQEVILQMENEYGSTLVQTILTLLCITKEGLEDNDIHYLLSFVIHMNETKAPLEFDVLEKNISSLQPDNFLCQVKYCSLMYIISTFAYGQLRQKSFSLVGTEFENAVNKFYMNKHFVSYSRNMHCVLAAYYKCMCDTKGDGSYSGHSGFAFRCLLYHMLNGNLYQELANLLCNSTFIEAVFRTNADEEFLVYYSSILHDILPSNQKVSRQINEDCLFSYYDFVSRNFHIFHKNSSLVMQQALNEPPGSLVSTNKRQNHYLLENLSRSHMLNYRSATLCGFVKNITASAGERSRPIVVLGTEDGYIKILDLSTRKVVRSIKAHMSAITCITFVGKNRICVSSADSTLSLWDSDDFSRIAVLNGHRHTVTSCCSEPSGFTLYSSGWDNSVRSWNLRDGRSISVIDEFRCPVNCIDHHPTKQQIACGLWNGNIELWDTCTMKKVLECSNFCGAVKSLAYSPDGLNIISAFIQSEISIWSSEEGFKISSLKGHILPVKSLTYSFDDCLFVSGSDDCTLKVWSTEHGSNVSRISETKFCPVSFMVFMTKTHLAVAFQNSEIWIIDIISGNVTAKTTVKGNSVSAFSKYSFLNVSYQKSESNWYETSLVFGTESGKLMIFDALSFLVTTKAECKSKVTAVIHNCDIIVCGTAEGDIRIHSHPDNRLSYILHAAHKGFISTFCFLVNDQHLLILSTGNDNVLKLWRVEWKEQELVFERELFNKHKDSITSTVFYPAITNKVQIDNLFTGSHDNDIILWNEGSTKKFQGLQSSVVNIACSDDVILGCGNDGAAVMWSLNGKVLTSIPKLELSSATLTFHVEKGDSDKFSVTLAFVDQDGSIKIEKPLEKMYSCSLDGHSKPITSCCTTDDGQIVSCSLDNSVSLWNVPQDIPDCNLVHSSGITGIIFSASLGFAVSADCKGNLILWRTELDASSEPLIYCAKKSYSGGFIKTLSWLKNNCFACAVSQITEKDETNFLDVFYLKCNTETQPALFTLEVKKSYKFSSEVTCLDSCPTTDTIVVGLKSGDVSIITAETQVDMRLCSDWPLAVRLLTRDKSSDMLSISSADTAIVLYDIENLIKYYSPDDDSFGRHYADYSSTFMSSMCCGDELLVACGDSEGVLRIYSDSDLKFKEKVHNDTITGMCILGPYLFTSSLDKTVKGWNLSSYKQVCQFHSNTPVSCISSQTKLSCIDSCTFIIGTTSGNVNMIKFHSK